MINTDTAKFNPNKTADDNSAFRNRSKAPGGFEDPNELDYKALSVGDYVDIRFLDMSKEAFLEIPCRRVGKKNPKTNEQMTIVVRDFGIEQMNGMVDNYGVPINDCKKTFLYRLPIWVFGITTFDEKGKAKYEEVNEVKYVEFGPGLSQSLDKMEKLQGGACSFDESTGLPHYDVRLSIVPGPSKVISKNYAFEPVTLDPKTKRMPESFGQPLVDDKTNNIKGRFNAEQIELIKLRWPSIMESIYRLETIEDVKRNLDGTKKDGSGGSKSLSVREGLSGSEDYKID